MISCVGDVVPTWSLGSYFEVMGGEKMSCTRQGMVMLDAEGGASSVVVGGANTEAWKVWGRSAGHGGERRLGLGFLSVHHLGGYTER